MDTLTHPPTATPTGSTGRQHAYPAWSVELDDMQQIMRDAAAAITVDATLVDVETRETVRVFREAQVVQVRASALVATGRYGGMGRGK